MLKINVAPMFYKVMSRGDKIEAKKRECVLYKVLKKALEVSVTQIEPGIRLEEKDVEIGVSCRRIWI